MIGKTLILASVMAVALTACDKNEDTTSAPASAPSTTSPDSSSPAPTTSSPSSTPAPGGSSSSGTGG